MLSLDEIQKLRDAAVSAGLAGSRDALLVSLPPDLIARIPVTSKPGEQVLMDLGALHEAGTLADGSVPLLSWLSNAVALASGRREVTVFQRALERCKKALDVKPAVAPPPGPPPPPPDAPYDPRFYVHRPDEERRALAKLSVRGSPVVLWAPARFGATTTMRYLVSQVEEEDAKLGKEALVIETDLDTLLPKRSEPSARSADAFLESFAHHLLREARAGEAAFDAIVRDRGSWSDKLRYLMEDHVLPRARGRLVMVLDKADALWGEREVQGAFYKALRVWKDQAYKRPWSSLRLVLLISTTPSLVFDDPDHRDSPFFNLTADYIELREYTPDQVVELARLYGLSWGRDTIGRELYPLVGGHPYLLRVVMYRARLTGAPLSSILGDESALDRLFGYHLHALGRLLEHDPTLHDAIVRVLDDPTAHIDEDRFERLRRAGLLARTRQGLEVPYLLYERYLRRRWRR